MRFTINSKFITVRIGWIDDGLGSFYYWLRKWCGGALEEALARNVKCVNEIRAKGLKHRQFQSFLLEMNTQYKDLVHHSQVWWLSRGKVLRHFLSLLEETKVFLQEKSPTLNTKSGADVFTLLRDNTWLADFTFLIGVTQHTNNLCIRMQGRNQLLLELLNTVDAFQSKLELFQKRLSTGNMIQFKSMSLLLEKTKAYLVPDFEKYATMCGNLRENFSKRFQDLNDRKTQMKLFQRPFSVDVEYIDDADTQLELLDLRSNQVLHDVFQQNSLLEFYSRLEEEKYPVLLRNAKIWICLFASTYCFEQAFSIR